MEGRQRRGEIDVGRLYAAFLHCPPLRFLFIYITVW